MADHASDWTDGGRNDVSTLAQLIGKFSLADVSPESVNAMLALESVVVGSKATVTVPWKPRRKHPGRAVGIDRQDWKLIALKAALLGKLKRGLVGRELQERRRNIAAAGVGIVDRHRPLAVPAGDARNGQGEIQVPRRPACDDGEIAQVRRVWPRPATPTS